MVSVVIPVFHEPYLNRTIQSLLDNAKGEIEVILVLDGASPNEFLIKDARVKSIFKDHEGMRAAINVGIRASRGEWFMKVDAHCSFSPGFDEVLVRDCKESWLMVPRRYSLNEETWDIAEDRPMIDYQYLSFPNDLGLRYGYSFQVTNSDRRTKNKIGETMTIQGSCWFANKKHFLDHVYPLDDKNYGTFVQEPQEIALKYWLGGGAVKVNKKIWYAHLSKRKKHYDAGMFSSGYKQNAEALRGHEWATRHWMNNEEPNMIHPFSW